MLRRVAVVTAGLLVLAGMSPARASVTYDLNFTPISTNDPNFTASGSFTYDPAGGFSRFTVDWDGTTFRVSATPRTYRTHVSRTD